MKEQMIPRSCGHPARLLKKGCVLGQAEEVEFRAGGWQKACNVQQTINHLPDDDVDRELRETFTRKT